MPVSAALMGRIRELYPWMTPEMLDTYERSWATYDSEEVAMQEVRQTASYQSIFAGNYDSETGQVRMSESEYFATKASFDATVESFGLNPYYFEDEWVTALENEVSPRELTGRMEAAYERIIQNSDEVRRFYSENYGIDLTDQAILASAISPRIGEEILNRQIAVAEIGGAAAKRGFEVTGAFAEMLAQEDLSTAQAGQFFGAAGELIPAMQVLAQRHADPDDEFDLNDVSAALLFDDPEVRQRMRRLATAERSTFTGGAQLGYARNRQGGVGGLAEM